MADMQRLSLLERDTEQAITALKRGAHLLKYGRRGKPEFCPFRLSSDESSLIWYDGREENQLELCRVSMIIPGQRTAIFKRYPRPEKEYQSFSLIYDDRSLDLICKDKEEAEAWFSGLKALIARSNSRKPRNDSTGEGLSTSVASGRQITSSMSFFSPDREGSENSFQSKLGKVFAEVVSLTAATKNFQSSESVTSPQTSGGVESSNIQTSGAEAFRVSLSSAVSSSSQSSCIEDIDNLGDVFIWGEGTGDGVMGGGPVRADRSPNAKINSALLPKLLESTMVLDVQTISCGHRHAALISKQGEIFSWGEEAGGRLGHGVVADTSQPKLIEALSGKGIEMVACGTYHTCAITASGELYTWGDGALNYGLLGHGSEASHWIPSKVSGPLEGVQVSFISCGPWHTAFLTPTGRLFTFGDGTFGVLGHGDYSSSMVAREVEVLKGLKTVRVACGTWHTAAVVDTTCRSSDLVDSKQTLSGKVYTWGDGDKGRLGHGDDECRLVPEPVASLIDIEFSRVACGENFTVALTTSGRVYSMGSTTIRGHDEKLPFCVEGNITDIFVEEISCGSQHVAVLTSKGEVYTWGKGVHGQLGHGDTDDRTIPTLVKFLKDKQVKSIACGSNFTAAICLHKGISCTENSMCSGCHNPFTFIRKRHNCYNCGLVFCKSCTSRRSIKASLAPSRSKPYRVCDDCFAKLQKFADSASVSQMPTVKSEGLLSKSVEFPDRESGGFRLPGPVSRLSSAESFKSTDRSSTFSLKVDLNDSRIFPLHDGSTSSKSPSSPPGSLPNFRPFFLPDSRSASQSPSPVPGRSPLRSTMPSPSTSQSFFSSDNLRPFFLPDSKSHSQSPLPAPGKGHRRSITPSPSSSASFFSSEPTIDELKINNYNISLEVKTLKAQVEKLASKSRVLETELGRKSKQLKEAQAQAAEEIEKNKAAKGVIKSLSAQLKEMAERGTDVDIHEIATNNSCASNGYDATSSPSPNSASSGSSTPSSSSNGTRDQSQKPERIIQDEAGVYVTVASLANSVNELRRIRFSRKLFTEAEAEKWWTENGAQLCERHNIRVHGSHDS